MRKFARASEQNNIPDYIDQQFFGKDETSITSDRFAKLRERSQNNSQRIARATSTYERDRDKEIVEQAWAVSKPAETYSTPMLREVSDDMSEASIYDVNSRSIRRSSYDVDDKLNRSRDLSEILNEDNYANFTHLKNMDGARSEIGRHASIFGGSLEDITEICHEKMEKHLDSFDRKTYFEKKASRHNNWEAEQATKLASARRPDIVSSSVVLRTGEGTYSDSAFGMQNVFDIDRTEAERRRIVSERRASSLSLKRKGQSPRQARAEKHIDWENENRNKGQRSYQGHESSWLDAHLNALLKEE